MIAFDLFCENDHVFEAWFKDRDTYEEQSRRGLIECPICGNNNIKKRPSQFAIMKGGKREAQGEGLSDRDAAIEILKRIHSYIMKNTEDVGTKFAETALKMHYGVLEPKNIRGVATEEQEKMLQDEGIDFFKLPVLSKQRGEGDS